MKTLAITVSVLAVLSTVSAEYQYEYGPDNAFCNDNLNFNYDELSFNGPLSCKTGTADDSPYFQASVDDLFITPGSVCGQTVNDPCIISMRLADTDPATNDPCGKCYLLTHTQDEVIDERCRGGKCPAFQTTIMTQVQNKLEEGIYSSEVKARFQLNALGWKQLCPSICGPSLVGIGGSTCALADYVCTSVPKTSPVPDPSFFGRYPSSYFGDYRTKQVTWKRVICGSTLPDGDDSYGEVGTFPPPSRSAYSSYVVHENPLSCKNRTADDSPHFKSTAADDYWVEGNSCGQTVNDPCIIGMDLADTEPATTDPCGKCYLITLKQNAVTDDRCNFGVCPGFEKTIMTQVQTGKQSDINWIPGHERRKFDISYLGWKELCSAPCGNKINGSWEFMPTCTDSATDCKTVNKLDIVRAVQNVTWKRVVCGSTVPDGDDSYGEVGPFPLPPHSAYSSYVVHENPLSCKNRDHRKPHPEIEPDNIPYFKSSAADDYWVEGNSCGLTLNDPCIIGMDLADTEPATTDPCGKCYLITLKQNAVTDDRCKNGACPGFEKTIMTQVQTGKQSDINWIPGHEGRRFEISYLGWKELCSPPCARRIDGALEFMPTCTDSVTDCKSPTQFENVRAVQKVSWKRVKCGTTDADGDDFYGEVGTFPR